ncbi:MAG: histidine kinase [Saprospiraceae bacterium]|nr:histidine kinase [Saprospiraceae bacterium]
MMKILSLNSSEHLFLDRRWLIFFWLTIALISTQTLYIQLGMQVPWGEIFIVKLAIWLFWGLYTPLILWGGRRFRIEGNNHFKDLIFHLPFSVLSIAINVFFYAFFAWLVGVDSFEGVPLLNIFTGLFVALFEWYFIIYWAIIILSYAFAFYRSLKSRELEAVQLEAQLVTAQLQALKMQLQPHFLFNTLNTVASLVRQDQKPMAVEMLSDLSSLLRTTLLKKDAQQVSLEEEIAFLKNYLVLEKKRFGDRVQVQWDIAEDTLPAQIPVYLLQPVVENAIYHGLSKQLKAEVLHIKASKEGKTLRLSVYNDGPSLPADFDLNFTTGIGLSNIIERLSQLYADQAGLSIRNEGQGVQVSIFLPYRT